MMARPFLSAIFDAVEKFWFIAVIEIISVESNFIFSPLRDFNISRIIAIININRDVVVCNSAMEAVVISSLNDIYDLLIIKWDYVFASLDM